MSFYKEVPGFKTTLESVLKFDKAPVAGSTNPVTSEGVKDAIDGAVGDASEALQEQIDDIAEKAGSGYTPKGEASVATLNALSGQENGELYTMTDAGTLTDGSLAVVAGDTVAWDATNEVWYKAMDYAPRQYGTNEVHNLPTTITAFRTGDVIAVDGPSGTAKMGKDSLLALTAENAIAGNIAPAFDPSRDSENPYKSGESVTYNGKVYTFKVDHHGAWSQYVVDPAPAGKLFANRQIVLDDNRESVLDFGWARKKLFLSTNAHYGDSYDDFEEPSTEIRWYRSELIDVGYSTTGYLRNGCFKSVRPIVYFNSDRIIIGWERSSAETDVIEERELVFPPNTKYVVVQACVTSNNLIGLNDVTFKMGKSIYDSMELTFENEFEKAESHVFFESDTTKFATHSSLNEFSLTRNPYLVTYSSAIIGTTKYGDGQGTQYGNNWYSTGLIPKQDFIAEIGVYDHRIVVPICFYDKNLVLVGIEDLLIERNNLFQYSRKVEDFPEDAEYFVLQYSSDYGTAKLFFRGREKNRNDAVSIASLSEEVMCDDRYLWRGYQFGVYRRDDAIGMSYFEPTGHDSYGNKWQRSALITIPYGADKLQTYQWQHNAIAPVVFFDKDGLSISYEKPNNSDGLEQQTFDIPSDAVYFCIQSDNSENSVPDWSNLKVWYKFSKLNSLNKEISLLYKVFGYRDRRFAFLGDSITDPNHIGTTKNYWQFLEEMLGLKSYSYGANGAQSNQIITQVDAAIAAATTDGEKIDVLSLFFGTNDYNADIPIGEWYTETEESVVRHGSTVTLKKKVFNTNNSTFKGRLYNGVLYAKQQLPDTKIIVITPIHRGQYGNETNRQPSELYANALGLYIDDYIAAVKELGNVLAVEVIDLNAICGLYPLLDEFAKFFSSASDKLHPNALGHYRMACAIASKLISTNNKVV